jgi:hypothetical protein
MKLIEEVATQGADARPVAQSVIDHCWTMYREGQIAVEAKESFTQMLQSFAKWLANRNVAPQPSASATADAKPLQAHALGCRYIMEDDPWAPCTCGYGGPNDAKPADGVLSDERIVQIFYPMGTATDNQKLIAIAVGRAILAASMGGDKSSTPPASEA